MEEEMKRVLLMLMFSLFLFLSAQSVYACTCVGTPPPRQALKEATAVFVGEVISKKIFDVKDEFGALPVVRVRFAVSRIWKGIEGGEVVVLTAESEDACGYNFEKRKKYLVYAYPDPWKLGVLETGICNRTRKLESAAKDLRAIGKGTKP
jgi:Tissue inhibitor of metalloproteinase